MSDQVAAALNSVASAIGRLGNADALTPLGGLEAHGMAMLEAAQVIAGGLSEVADAIRGLREEPS